MTINIGLLTFGQKVILFFILIEFLIVALFVIASYLAKLWLEHGFKQQKTKMEKIQKFIHHPGKMKKPKNLTLIFLTLQESNISQQQKSDFVKQHLLNKLRKYANARSWIKRYLLIEAYNYVIENQDKDNLILLINDANTIISLNAARLNNKLRDTFIYEVILCRLYNVDQATRSLYFALLTPCPELKNAIEHILETNDNTLLRKVCFDIIYNLHMEKGFYDSALRDIKKSDRNCQLAAIRVLGRADPDRAKNVLFELLKSDNWLIRNAALQSIKDLDVPGVAEELYKCLNDENYWIRVNAAKELVAIGKEGRAMLDQYEMAAESQYKEVATYFLGMDITKDDE